MNTNSMKKANDYLLDASDFAAVLETFLNTNNDKYDRGRAVVVVKKIDELVNAAQQIVIAA